MPNFKCSAVPSTQRKYINKHNKGYTKKMRTAVSEIQAIYYRECDVRLYDEHKKTRFILYCPRNLLRSPSEVDSRFDSQEIPSIEPEGSLPS
jgi:hypothetical protein